MHRGSGQRDEETEDGGIWMSKAEEHVNMSPCAELVFSLLNERHCFLCHQVFSTKTRWSITLEILARGKKKEKKTQKENSCQS